MTDLVTFGETALRLSPPGSERLEAADRLSVSAAGAASNVAVAASRLGTDAAWLSKVADTPLGRRAVSELRGHGIETAVTWADDGRQGLTFTEREHRPREGRVLDDRHDTAIESVRPGDLPMDAVQDAGAVFVSGETVGLSTAVAETAAAVLRATGGRAVLGLDYRPGLWSATEARETLAELFPAADVFVTNVEEVRTVLDLSGDAAEVAHRVGSEHGFETVILTRGGRGALVWHDTTIHERDAVEADAVDATGQHDAFTGAFLGRRLAGDPVGDALAHGVGAAALARTIPGPVPAVDPADLRRVVESMDVGSDGTTGSLR